MQYVGFICSFQVFLNLWLGLYKSLLEIKIEINCSIQAAVCSEFKKHILILFMSSSSSSSFLSICRVLIWMLGIDLKKKNHDLIVVIVEFVTQICENGKKESGAVGWHA